MHRPQIQTPQKTYFDGKLELFLNTVWICSLFPSLWGRKNLRANSFSASKYLIHNNLQQHLMRKVLTRHFVDNEKEADRIRQAGVGPCC